MDERELYHHGILGQKWGVRRYQNKDGSLTSEGKKRLDDYKENELKKLDRRTKFNKSVYGNDKFMNGYYDRLKNTETELINNLKYSDIWKEKLTTGAAATSVAAITLSGAAIASLTPAAIPMVPLFIGIGGMMEYGIANGEASSDRRLRKSGHRKYYAGGNRITRITNV